MRRPLQRWIGNPCTLVDRDEIGAWFFGLNGAGSLTVHCAWRVVKGGRIVLSRDDGQLFTPPADALAECRSLLVGRTVEQVIIADVTADLTVAFAGGTTLQALNTSARNDGWRAVCPSGGPDIVAKGGGGWDRAPA